MALRRRRKPPQPILREAPLDRLVVGNKPPRVEVAPVARLGEDPRRRKPTRKGGRHLWGKRRKRRSQWTVRMPKGRLQTSAVKQRRRGSDDLEVITGVTAHDDFLGIPARPKYRAPQERGDDDV